MSLGASRKAKHLLKVSSENKKELLKKMNSWGRVKC